jgi:U3 small nucleolar ribonucleoprotein component
MEKKLINFYNDEKIKQILIKKIKDYIEKDSFYDYSELLYMFISSVREVENFEKLEKESSRSLLKIGDYQGDLCMMYKIDDDNIYVTNTYYGSCSGCDTLQSISCIVD